jgi:hypothetical protein
VSALVHRPTENAAIGRIKPRPVTLGLLLLDRATARRRIDRYADHLLGHRIVRALAGGQVGA